MGGRRFWVRQMLRKQQKSRTLESTTLAMSITYGTTEYFFDRPMPVGRFIKGTDQPFVHSNQPFNVVKITPECQTYLANFTWKGITYTNKPITTNGAMIDPWLVVDQGLDQMLAYGVDGTTGSDSFQAYNDPTNVDPSKPGNGPIVIGKGDSMSIVKSVRDQTLVDPTDFGVLHVVSEIPPLGALAPDCVGTDKTSYFTIDEAQKSALGAGFSLTDTSGLGLNLTSLATAEAGGYFPKSFWPFFGQPVSVRKRMMGIPGALGGGYAGSYGVPWMDFFIAAHSMGQSCPDWARARILQLAVTWLGWINKGHPGGAGAGQWLANKYPLMLLSHSFPNMPGLNAKCANFRGNATHQQFWITQQFIAKNVYFPDLRPHNHGVFQPAMLGKPHWNSELGQFPPNYDPGFDAVNDAEYQNVSSKVGFPEMFLISLLVNGTNGWNGMQSSMMNATIDPAKERCAHVAYMDRLFTFCLRTNEIYGSPPTAGKYREWFGRLRDTLTPPRYQGLPDAPQPSASTPSAYLWAGTGSNGAPVGAFGFNLTNIGHSYPAATGAEVQYSYAGDRMTWVPIAGTTLSGVSPILPPGAYAVRWRLINDFGPSQWTVNFPRLDGQADRMIITVAGSAPTGAVTQLGSYSPAIYVQQFPGTAEPSYKLATEPFDLTQSQVIYISRGFQTGPVATPIFQGYRNGVAIPGATTNSYNITGADTGAALYWTVDVGGTIFQTNTLNIPLAPARPAGVVIDQVIDATLPINYPKAWQSFKDNLINASVTLDTNGNKVTPLEPQRSDFAPFVGEDLPPPLYTGRMRAVYTTARPRAQINLSADEPLVTGRKYNVTGFYQILGQASRPMQGRPIVRLGTAPNSDFAQNTEYFYSEVPGPAYPTYTSSNGASFPQPALLAIEKLGFVAQGPDLWLSVGVGGASGAPGDVMLTGRFYVVEAP